MKWMGKDWKPALLGVVCQSAWLAFSFVLLALLSASHALDFADRDLNSQRQFSPPQMQRYVNEIVRRYDADGDGRLQTSEWRLMRGQPQHIDHDGDGLLTYEEMLRHVSQYAVGKRFAPLPEKVVPPQPAPPASYTQDPVPGTQNPVPGTHDPVSGSQAPPPDAKPYFVSDRLLPQGLPDWFRARDANGDAQLSLAEFAPTGEAQLAAQFQRSDANRDGLITPAEAIRGAEKLEAGASTGGTRRENSGVKGASGAQ